MEFNIDAITPNVRFDPRVKRYRYIDTGQFLKKEAALNLTKGYIEREKVKLIELADKLESGEITLFQFQLRAAEHLKHIHVSSGILGAGGSEYLTSNDFLTIARKLKNQYYSGIGEDGKRYGLKFLAMDIEAGNVSVARLKQRLAMYADSGQQSYWQMKRDRARDKPWEVRVLDPLARHCGSCIAHASRGIQKLGVLPLPSQDCTCYNRCRCELIQLTLEEAVARGLSV
ncbi:MAG: hypothetical protein KME47_09455 [Nodosilinea sp. WJT8-NPBG4]|jgi:hypothetical protein|nr:hypothetical protein [Nodosilinea sp. WJT8-NPBG4]